MKSSLLQLILLCLIVSACHPAYVPSVRHATFYKRAGEVQAKVYGVPFVNSEGYGFDAQLGASVTNHIAIVGAYTRTANSGYEIGSESNYFKHHYGEGGVGYYNNFKANRFSFQILAGYGRGTGSVLESYPDVIRSNATQTPVTYHYEKYFIQPAFGIRHRNFTFGPALRLSWVNFTNYISESKSATFHDAGNFLIEPAIAFQSDLKNIKVPVLSRMSLFGQLGFNFMPKRVNQENVSKFNNEYQYSAALIAVGLGFRLNDNRPIKPMSD